MISKILFISLIGFLVVNCNTQEGNNKQHVKDVLTENYKKQISVEKECSFDQEHRKNIDSLIDKVAIVSTISGDSLLVIDGNEYFPCNLPVVDSGQSILISAYILETFGNEKVIATPIKLFKIATK